MNFWELSSMDFVPAASSQPARLNPLSRPFAPKLQDDQDWIPGRPHPSRESRGGGNQGNQSNNTRASFSFGFEVPLLPAWTERSAISPGDPGPAASISWRESGEGSSTVSADSGSLTKASRLPAAEPLNRQQQPKGRLNPSVSSSSMGSMRSMGAQARESSSRARGSSLPVNDPYGLRGLLEAVRQSESHPREHSIPQSAIPSIALGWKEAVPMSALHPSCLESVLSESNGALWLGPHSDADMALLPEDYRLHERRRRTEVDHLKLTSPELLHWPTDLLFYFFYTAVGDAMQIHAGKLLHRKGWRYSKSNQLWIARYPSQPPVYRDHHGERGIFQYFDPLAWSRMSAHITVIYDDLEAKCELSEATAGFSNGIVLLSNGNTATRQGLSQRGQLALAHQKTIVGTVYNTFC